MHLNFTHMNMFEYEYNEYFLNISSIAFPQNLVTSHSYSLLVLKLYCMKIFNNYKNMPGYLAWM